MSSLCIICVDMLASCGNFDQFEGGKYGLSLLLIITNANQV
jgi:hypothetical protein